MSETTLIINGELLTPHRRIAPGYVMFNGERILEIGEGTAPTTQSSEVIDAAGRTVAPGLIDLQVNGGGGAMISGDQDLAGLHEIARAHARTGTVGIVPTVISDSKEAMLSAIRTLVEAIEVDWQDGARLLGIHLEGPYLSPKKRGGHTAQFLRSPSLPEFRKMANLARGHLRILTLAPELEGAMEVMEEAAGMGILVSAGHTLADFATMRSAVGHGLRLVTHLFNAMGQMEGREPSTVGSALAIAELGMSVIADGKHVHPESLRVAIRAKGVDSTCAITDAVAPLGTDLKNYVLNGVDVEVRDGGCYTPDGILAGSATPLAHGVRNLVNQVGLSPLDALRMATTVPARLLGLSGLMGELAVGAQPDVVIFGPTFAPEVIFLRGRLQPR